MIHRMTLKDLHERLDKYTSLGYIGLAMSYISTPVYPPPIQDLISLVNDGVANNQVGQLTAEQRLRVLRAYAQLDKTKKQDPKIEEFIYSFRENNTACYFNIIKQLHEANLLDATSLMILSQSIVAENDDVVPAPSTYQLDTIDGYVSRLVERQGLNHGILRWLVLTACKFGSIHNPSYEELLKVKPLTFQLATMIGRSANLLTATQIYITNVKLFHTMPDEAHFSSDPMIAVVAIDRAKKRNVYTPENQKIILEASAPCDVVDALAKMKELKMDFDVSFLLQLKDPLNFVTHVDHLKKAGIPVVENIGKLVAAAVMSDNFLLLVQELHSLKMLNTETFNFIEKCNYNMKTARCLYDIPKKLVTKDLLEKLENRKSQWFQSFQKALIILKDINVPINGDILNLLLNTRCPVTKASSLVELNSSGLWNDETKNLLSETSAKHGETMAVTQVLCSLQKAKLQSNSIFNDLSQALKTAKSKRDDAGLSDSDTESSPKVSRSK